MGGEEGKLPIGWKRAERLLVVGWKEEGGSWKGEARSWKLETEKI